MVSDNHNEISTDTPPKIRFFTIADNEYGANFVRRICLILWFWSAFIPLSVFLVYYYSGKSAGFGLLIFALFLLNSAEKIMNAKGYVFSRLRGLMLVVSIVPVVPIFLLLSATSPLDILFAKVVYFGVVFPAILLCGWGLITLLQFGDSAKIDNELAARKKMYERYLEWRYDV